VLWPETTTIRANANLRSALWRAQRSCGRLIVASTQDIALDDGVVIDYRVAMSRAYSLVTGAEPCEEDFCAGTLANLSTDLLVDWYDDWVTVERERYHQLRLHALELLCARLTVANRHGEAVDAGLAAVRAEPLRESAHRILIQAYLAEGNRGEAVRQYERCSRILLDELGLEPSASLRELVPVPWRPLSRNGAPASGFMVRRNGPVTAPAILR
jgi:DNA-binding SARP family transcriptional activator